MTDSEKYFIGLVKTGRIVVDPDSGVVRSFVNGKLNRPVSAKSSAGYIHMSAGPNRKERHYMMAHRLIWIALKGDIPPGKEVNHKNGNKSDNRLCNLELVSRSENIKHAHYTLGKVFGVWAINNKK